MAAGRDACRERYRGHCLTRDQRQTLGGARVSNSVDVAQDLEYVHPGFIRGGIGMGDKGGKKDKEKSKQQQSKRQEQQAKEKQAKVRTQATTK